MRGRKEGRGQVGKSLQTFPPSLPPSSLTKIGHPPPSLAPSLPPSLTYRALFCSLSYASSQSPPYMSQMPAIPYARASKSV